MKERKSQLHKVLKRILPRKLWKVLILSFGILLTLCVFVVLGLNLAAGSRLCASCHEMKPEYVTWQVSSHNKLACIECHSEDGSAKGFLVRAASLGLGYKHLAGKYLLPITSSKPIKDGVCLRCHELNTRIVTPSGDIIIPHEKHAVQGISCLECHSGVTHGKISLRQQTIDGDFERWTGALGEAQMQSKFRTASMKQCMDCHKEKKIALTCETCHKKIMLPASHSSSDWILLGVHGKEARNSLEDCDRCHSFTNQPEQILGLDKVTEYARSNTFCYECHSKAPPSHDQAWRQNHAQKADGEGRNGCLVCHSAKQPKTADKAIKTFCAKCHKSQHQNWNPSTHPINLGKTPKFKATCTTCHSPKTCGKCHNVTNSS